MGRPPTQRPPPLDGRWGWLIVVGCCLGHFTLVGFSRVFGVFFLPWMEKFDSNAAETSWVQSLFNTMRMLSGPVVSVLCESLGCRSVVMLGGLLYAAGCLGAAFATRLLHLYVSFGLAGFGGSFILTPMFVILNQYFDRKKGIAMGVSTMGSGLGQLALPPAMTYFMDNYGHFGTMLISSALSMNTFVVAMLFRPIDSVLNRRMEERNKQPVAPLQDNTAKFESMEDIQVQIPDVPERISVEIEDNSRLARIKQSLQVLKSTTFWIYSFYIAALPCGVQLFSLYTPGMMAERGLSAGQSAVVLSVGGGSDMVGRFMAGLLFDCRAVRTRRWPVHCCFGALLGAAVLCVAFQTHMAGFVVVAVWWGITEATYHSQRATIITEILDRDQVTRAVGFMLFWQGVGTLISPTFAGFLRDKFHTFKVCFYYGGTAMAFCALLFLANFLVVDIRRRRKRVNLK